MPTPVPSYVKKLILMQKKIVCLHQCICVSWNIRVHNYTRFFVRKIGYINFVPKSVCLPSVRLSLRHVSCNCIFSYTVGRSNFKLCRYIDHMVTFRATLTLKVKGQIMYFLVNASPHKLFKVATSNFACA